MCFSPSWSDLLNYTATRDLASFAVQHYQRHRVTVQMVMCFFISAVCFSLYRGRFGQVHKCAELSSGITLAAKIIKVKGMKERVSGNLTCPPPPPPPPFRLLAFEVGFYVKVCLLSYYSLSSAFILSHALSLSFSLTFCSNLFLAVSQ